MANNLDLAASPASRYWETQTLMQIYTANHATFPMRIRKITVKICENFWITQHVPSQVIESYS